MTPINVPKPFVWNTVAFNQLVEKLDGRQVLIETWRTRQLGHSLTIGNTNYGHRLAGPEVTGGTLTHAFTVDATELLYELLAHAFDPNNPDEEDE